MNLPEIIYSSSNSAESRTLSRLVQEGKIRKILPKAYTSNFEQTDEEIIRKHLFQLIWKHYPEAIVSHRSAFEFEPTEKGNVYLTSSQNRKVKWPGVTLRISKGKEALDNDNPIYKTSDCLKTIFFTGINRLIILINSSLNSIFRYELYYRI